MSPDPGWLQEEGHAWSPPPGHHMGAVKRALGRERVAKPEAVGSVLEECSVLYSPSHMPHPIQLRQPGMCSLRAHLHSLCPASQCSTGKLGQERGRDWPRVPGWRVLRVRQDCGLQARAQHTPIGFPTQAETSRCSPRVLSQRQLHSLPWWSAAWEDSWARASLRGRWIFSFFSCSS